MAAAGYYDQEYFESVFMNYIGKLLLSGNFYE